MGYKIITISRQYGAGGHIIGKILSEKLSIPLYDGEIITKVATESGLSEAYIAEKGEYGKRSSLESYFIDGMYYQGPTVEDNIWAVQNKIIKNLAQESACIIVGRCADYILKERDDVLSVFLHADMDFRISLIGSEIPSDVKNQKKYLADRDKRRSAYVQFYTDMKWGEARNYALTIDTGLIGVEKSASIIESIYK